MRIGQVGCGEHATVAHGPALARYAAAHPDVVLAACADPDTARAEAFRFRFGFGRTYADAVEMAGRERLDAAVVAVPVEQTAQVAGALFARGLPLLIEKPPGATVAEVDALSSAAADVPHQVAFNRRFVPQVRELRRRLHQLGEPQAIHHVHYEMTRVDRRDVDFSVTAIHGIDAVRYLCASDYRDVCFRYTERPALGQGVADIFLDAQMESGATAHLVFCPVAGILVERATVHLHDHTFFLRVPMWAGLDSPGRLQHFYRGRQVLDLEGGQIGEGEALFEMSGFAAQTEAFLEALRMGRRPAPGLADARQSVAVAEQIRLRRAEYHAGAPGPGMVQMAR